MKTVRTVLVLCVREGELLLAYKKRGFGLGKLNGAGGKIEVGETPEEAAVRELAEEFGLVAAKENLRKAAECLFYFGDPPICIHNHAFLLEAWRGEPSETEEMGPLSWWNLNALPYERMWADDILWLPRALRGERLACEFWFAEDNETIARHLIVALGA